MRATRWSVMREAVRGVRLLNGSEEVICERGVVADGGSEGGRVVCRKDGVDEDERNGSFLAGMPEALPISACGS